MSVSDQGTPEFASTGGKETPGVEVPGIDGGVWAKLEKVA
jgi:hypothetical protein